MKKLLPVLFLFAVMSAFGQSITDEGLSIKIVYSSGYTASIIKSNIVEITLDDYVGVVTSSRDDVRAQSKTYYLKGSDFGYASNSALFTYLNNAKNEWNPVTTSYVYSSDTLRQIIKYVGSDTLVIDSLTYTSGNLTLTKPTAQ